MKKRIFLFYYYLIYYLTGNVKKLFNVKKINTGWSTVSSKFSIISSFYYIKVFLKSDKLEHHIKDTPHFKFINEYALTGYKSDVYRDYITKYFPNKSWKLEEQKFLKLFDDIKKSKFEAYAVGRLQLLNPKKIKIIDGVHRLSIIYLLKRSPVIFLYHDLN